MVSRRSWGLLSLVPAAMLLAGCGEGAGSASSSLSCSSQASVDALKRHVISAADASESTNPQLDQLTSLLRYSSDQADTDLQPAFRNALAEVERVLAGGRLDGQKLAISASEFVDRGASEDSGKLCWARVDVGIASESSAPVSRMITVLTDVFLWDREALNQRTTVELFYTLTAGAAQAVTVSESDLSANSATAIRGIAQITQIAPTFVAPFEAAEQAKERRERELEAAQSRLADASLGEARLSNSRMDAELNATWERLTEPTRNSLQQQQRQWIRLRNARCAVEGQQYSADPTEIAIVESRCLARETANRINELRRYK